MGDGTTIFLMFIGAIVVSFFAAVYFIGIPAEWKVKASEKVAEHMAEGQAKEALQSQLSNLPEADRETARQLQKGLGSLSGGDLKNPLGKKNE